MPGPSKAISMLVWNEFTHDARVLKEANSLANAGYSLTVFALKTSNELLNKQVLPSGVIVRRINGMKAVGGDHKKSIIQALFKASTQLFAMIKMTYLVIRSKPSVIHAHDIEVLPAGWLASRLTSSKLVYDAHEISTGREGFQSLKKLVGWIEKKLMPKASATITTTELRAKFFARAYGIPRPTVLQNRPEWYELESSTKIRDVLNLIEEWPIVLYQGGFQEGRGLERLVEVSQYINNAYFIFIGNGRLEKTLLKKAADLNVSNRVKFIPKVSLAKLPEYTSSADIGVQPLQNTCFNHFTTDSNKLFEYALAGLPIIATDFPEIRKLVKNYGLGLLAEDSQEALIDAIKTLVNEHQMRAEFAENALRYRRELSWSSQEPKLLKLYETIGSNAVD